MRAVVNYPAHLTMVLLTTSSTVVGAGDLRLIEAARRQDAHSVRAILLEKIDVDSTQGDGATALHWAAYWDDHATADLLIEGGANVNVANELGATPLFLACRNASGSMVEKLLAAGANPNLSVSVTTSEPPLMTAARSGSVEAVRALLARGANPNVAETIHGQTALMWATAHGHSAVIRTLIAAGADIHARSRIDRMRVMFAGEKTVDFAGGGFTPILFAGRRGDVDSTDLLLKAGADINDTTPDGTSVLAVAAHSGHGELAAHLLDRGADPNADRSGYTPLHAAVLRGDLALVQSLLNHRADPNAKVVQGTPFNRASRDFALNVNWIGATPFWLAAKFVEVEILRALLAAGADPHVAIPDGTTALMVAAGLGFAGERDDRRGRRREPGEFVDAVQSGEDERQALAAVKLLTDLGLDVNAANTAGDTALHAAASRKERSVVQWLADRGAKLDPKNKRGETPLSIASTFSRTEADEGGVDTNMIELLRRLGAKE